MAQMRTPVAIALGTLLLTSGCGWLGSAGQGTLTGSVTLSGGPAVAADGPAFTGQPQKNGTVSLWSNGQQVASTTTDSQGRYSINVKAGTYSIDACGALPPDSGDSVTVNAETTTQHDDLCSVP